MDQIAAPMVEFGWTNPVLVDVERYRAASSTGLRIRRTGQVWEEPIGEPMRAKNTNAGEPMEILVVQISDDGEPLMHRADLLARLRRRVVQSSCWPPHVGVVDCASSSMSR